MPFETKRARRKDIFVQYVQVTSENMAELAEWCKGKIRAAENGKLHIYVPHVLHPIDKKQKEAYVGDILLKSPSGFKIFTERGFRKAFEDAPE